MNQKQQFTSQLLRWNKQQNKRQMPWKGEKDPYKIWLSEIILQQTRVEQGLAYYNNFIKTFPSIHHLARAKDEKVFKLWEGLGYYTRCRNLLATARFISGELNGKFPDSYENIKALKGIGPYTAAAISSFAYNLPHAVVDGNVFRVLARVFGISKAIDNTKGKNYFTELAEELLDKKQPGLYNQAIMDFGAVVCKPAAPLCDACVLKKVCYAWQHHKVDTFPVKEKKISIKKRWFYYLVMEYKNTIAIRQRTGKDIWQSLYEFPLIETTAAAEQTDIIKKATEQKWLKAKNYSVKNSSPLYKQQLSHQHITGQFLYMVVTQKPAGTNDWQWIAKKELKRYAFPRMLRHFIHNELPQRH
jgi:A/G-specific adenine glycosylase